MGWWDSPAFWLALVWALIRDSLGIHGEGPWVRLRFELEPQPVETRLDVTNLASSMAEARAILHSNAQNDAPNIEFVIGTSGHWGLSSDRGIRRYVCRQDR
jgi:hypothetical protein